MKQPRYYVAAALLGTGVWLAEPAGAQVPDSAFVAWWDRTLWTRAHLDVPPGVEREDHVYTSLPAYTGSIDLTPIDVQADSLEVRVLHHAAAATWLLVVPWYTLEQVRAEECVYKSWLLSTAGADPFEMTFDPYCLMSYGPDETFTLYRLRAGALPWIELGTNAPACAPVYLIRFDERTEQFILERDECGG
jgi:hypothetical protein